MATNRTDLIPMLNHLITTCENGSEGYRTAAEGVGDAEYKDLFLELGAQREAFATELRREMDELGEEPRDSTTAPEAAQRAWINIRSAISGGTDAVLEECERAEEAAVDAYERALKTRFPGRLDGVVRRQSGEIGRARDRIVRLHRGAGPEPEPETA